MRRAVPALPALPAGGRKGVRRLHIRCRGMTTPPIGLKTRRTNMSIAEIGLDRSRTQHPRVRCRFLAFLLVPALLGVSGCASLSSTEKGAAAGAGAGGVIGGVIGSQTGSTARGAIIGAAIGGTAGAIIGNRMDEAAKELENDLPDATVERVGEGIVVTFDSGILFDFDSSSLRYLARRELDKLAGSLTDLEQTEVLVVGHTDSVGDSEYNQRLSERRAESAASYLALQGVSGDRIIVEGRGEGEPVASNETAAGRQENRRVEVAIYASEEYRKEMKERYGGGLSI
jgi:outer membrane protein OmpA-like peptidoglycan-associated protein